MAKDRFLKFLVCMSNEGQWNFPFGIIKLCSSHTMLKGRPALDFIMEYYNRVRLGGNDRIAV